MVVMEEGDGDPVVGFLAVVLGWNGLRIFGGVSRGWWLLMKGLVSHWLKALVDRLVLGEIGCRRCWKCIHRRLQKEELVRVPPSESMSKSVSADSHLCFLIARQLYRDHRNALFDDRSLTTVLNARAGNRDSRGGCRRVGFRVGLGRGQVCCESAFCYGRWGSRCCRLLRPARRLRGRDRAAGEWIGLLTSVFGRRLHRRGC